MVILASFAASSNFNKYRVSLVNIKFFQIFLNLGPTFHKILYGTGRNLLTDNTLRKKIQDMWLRCLVVVSDQCEIG